MSEYYLICFLIFVIFRMSNYAEVITVSDTLADSTSFYYRQLSKYPAKKATLELSVSMFQVGSVAYQLDFFMFNGDFKPERNCSYQKFGQLRNEDLHIPLRSGRYRFVNCEDVDNRRSCHGKTTVQDFIPRSVAFAFGIDCAEKRNNLIPIQGLAFNISLYDASNHTKCSKDGRWVPGCQNYYSHRTFPNLMGNQFSWDTRSDFNTMNRFLRAIDRDYLQFGCYQHLHEFICYTLNPKCDPQTKQIVPPCRETCLDFVQGCTAHFGQILLQTKGNKKLQVANCNYLLDANGTLPCFYKPVTCPPPPDITNGLLVNVINSTKSHYLGSRLEYICQDEYDMKGNGTVTCLYSGQWSVAPVCEPQRRSSMGPLSIVLPVLIVPLILFITVIIRFTYLQKSDLHYYRRHKNNDAFVCYDIDDADYVHGTIIDEFEVKRNFKFCIHKRDFKPSYAIKWNIWNAIKNSNSAIIVMSQNYVDSMWCRDEFEGCYVENLEDPAFGVFVIMMQPVDTLDRTDSYMKSFFASRTYLEKNDPKLFEKIAQYLYNVKQPQKDGGWSREINVTIGNNDKEETLEMMLSSV